MGMKVAAFPLVPDTFQTVTLGETQYRLRLTWRHRCQAWYMDLHALDDTRLAVGRRLSPQSSPLLGLDIPDGPDGFLWVRGSDDYVQADLGDTLRLRYFTREEMQEAAAVVEDPDGVVVTV